MPRKRAMATDSNTPFHILVVDDDPEFAMVVERTLRLAGYKAIAATTFFSALDIIENVEQPIDLLFTDLQLESGNGFALARMARLRRRGLRTVYITGHDIANEDPALQILKKPVDSTSICRAVELAVASLTPRRGMT
jgi:DNA-binding NtrC family response regulator